MSVLTGPEIIQEYGTGRIIINPFNSEQMNEKGVSYDVTLMPKLAVMKTAGVVLALQHALGINGLGTRVIPDYDPAYEEVKLLYHSLHSDCYPEKGGTCPVIVDPANPPELFSYSLAACPILVPGVLYLASTNEAIGSDFYEPIIHGKSSLARLGLSVHETAGLGEPGFKYQWTLEMTCTHPIRLYPNMRIGQVVFETVKGEIRTYEGNYRQQEGPTGSRMDKYFKDGKPV